MRELLRLTSGSDPSAIWLATTDADTVVPPGWLRRQLGYADAGWDVVLGAVTITDSDHHPAHVPVAFAERYGLDTAWDLIADAYLATAWVVIGISLWPFSAK